MEYIQHENDFRLALDAKPQDIAEALLRAYQNAVRIAVNELPVIEW